MNRGTFSFAVTDRGDLVDGVANVETLRRLWLDRTMIRGSDLGPGKVGDFDHGAWHVACHMAAAGGVRRSVSGRLLWLSIAHAGPRDVYLASVTCENSEGPRTYPIASIDGQALLRGSRLLGFVEGTSQGHISARGVCDAVERFNGWRRQDFDRHAMHPEAGGTIWEHWCTLRDIRASDAIGTSVIRAFVTLAAAMGDLFVATAARTRLDYGHPKQLRALVEAGLTSRHAAAWDISPLTIPLAAEWRFHEARPADCLRAAGELPWSDTPRFYMFAREIEGWNGAGEIRQDSRASGVL